MSILGYIREAAPDDFPRHPRPKGYRLVVVDALVDENAWQLADEGRRCRFMQARKGCGRPAVVQLLRSAYYRSGRRYVAWGYCGDPGHLFGRRWVDGRLESPKLVREDEQP